MPKRFYLCNKEPVDWKNFRLLLCPFHQEQSNTYYHNGFDCSSCGYFVDVYRNILRRAGMSRKAFANAQGDIFFSQNGTWKRIHSPNILSFSFPKMLNFLSQIYEEANK